MIYSRTGLVGSTRGLDLWTRLARTGLDSPVYRIRQQPAAQWVKYYGKGEIEKIVPYFWLPLWSGDIKDPSARVLNVYKNDDEETL